LLAARGWVVTWGVAIAGALRIFGIAWNIMTAPVLTATDAGETDVHEVRLGDEPEARTLAAGVATEEETRAPIDRSWVVWFIVTLFAIHIGRMSTDFTLLGLVSPAVAVLGDMFIAVV